MSITAGAEFGFEYKINTHKSILFPSKAKVREMKGKQNKNK